MAPRYAATLAAFPIRRIRGIRSPPRFKTENHHALCGAKSRRRSRSRSKRWATFWAARREILDKVRCPDAIAANSVLAAASLAVQAHAEVVLPATGHTRPLSLFLATVAASGERKSEADHEASRPIRKREEALREVYEGAIPDYRLSHRAWQIAAREAEKTKGGRAAKEAALKAIGKEPQPPLMPMLTCGEPTLEGLHKLFAAGQPALGIFSDEGGAFISGHAMALETG